MTEQKKKKYYKEKEYVWIKELKARGRIKSLDLKNYEAMVTYFLNGELVSSVFKLWEITKLRKDESKPKGKGVNRKQLKVLIKYFDNEIDKVAKIAIGDWIDLRAAESIELKAGEFKLIPLGVAMQLPEGYEANVVPRSSTFKNYGILQANHYAVIDESYCGDNDQWFLPVYATRDTFISKNDRVCQFRINRKMPKVDFVEVEVLGNADRGGHGSTGVK